MSKDSTKELGTLAVVVLKAQNLNDKHTLSKQDPYAKISLGGTTQQTEIDKRGGQHPLWDTEFRFPIMKDSSDKFRKLDVSCWAKEPRTDDLLGQAKVDITETLRTGEFDDWVKLEINGVYRGEIYLEMTFFASAAPQHGSSQLASGSGSHLLAPSAGLNRRPSKLSPSDRIKRPTQAYAYPSESPAPSRPIPTKPGTIAAGKFKRPGPKPTSTDPPSFLRPGPGSRVDSGPSPGPGRKQNLAPPSHHSSPASSRSSSASPSRQERDSALPPLPGDLPNALKSGVPKPVPAILRPGGDRSHSSSPPKPSQPLSASPPRAEYAGPRHGRSPTEPVAEYKPVTGRQWGSPPHVSQPLSGSPPRGEYVGPRHSRSPTEPAPIAEYKPITGTQFSSAVHHQASGQSAAPYEASAPYPSGAPPAGPTPYAPATVTPPSQPVNAPSYQASPSNLVPYASGATPAPYPVTGQTPAPYVTPAQAPYPMSSSTPAPYPVMNPASSPYPPSYPPASTTLYPPTTPYTPPGGYPVQATSYQSYQHQHQLPPVSEPWKPAVNPLSFPVPHTPAPPANANSFGQRKETAPDPHLIARYQTPLPLPNQSSSQPSRPAHLQSQSPPSRPAQEQSPPSRPAQAQSPPSRPAQLQSSPQSPPAYGASPNTKLPKQGMSSAQRRAEEEIARRKAQEDQDLEFARQLDRELNLAEGT